MNNPPICPIHDNELIEPAANDEPFRLLSCHPACKAREIPEQPWPADRRGSAYEWTDWFLSCSREHQERIVERMRREREQDSGGLAAAVRRGHSEGAEHVRRHVARALRILADPDSNASATHPVNRAAVGMVRQALREALTTPPSDQIGTLPQQRPTTTDDAPVAPPLLLCPECAQGKHANCTGQALNANDDLVPYCECGHA
jgi:hypothetical protein